MIKTLRDFITGLAKRLKLRHVVDNEVSESELTDNDETDAALRAEFVKSWNSVEQFYRDDLLTRDDWQWLRPILALIEELRAAGYDKIFRAYTSTCIFGLSRSRRYDMQGNQPGLEIKIGENDGLTVTQWRQGQRKSISLSTTSVCPELLALLQELESEPIT